MLFNCLPTYSTAGPAIDSNSALENLNLSWNHLRGKGAVAIGKGLRANCSLKTLDLSWNGFADEGAAAVGESLKENNTLLNLDLSNNRISTQGAMILAKGLQVNNTLKMLRLERIQGFYRTVSAELVLLRDGKLPKQQKRTTPFMAGILLCPLH